MVSSANKAEVCFFSKDLWWPPRKHSTGSSNPPPKPFCFVAIINMHHVSRLGSARLAIVPSTIKLALLMRPELCDLLRSSGSTASENDKEDLRARGLQGHEGLTYWFLIMLACYLYIYPLEVNEMGCWLKYAKRTPLQSGAWTCQWCLVKTKDSEDGCVSLLFSPYKVQQAHHT